MNLTQDQANQFITVTLPILFAVALAIGTAVINLWGKLREVAARQQEHGKQIDSHDDKINTLALNTPSPAAPNAGKPVSGIVAVIALFFGLSMAGCDTTGNLTPQAKIAIGTTVVTLGELADTYSQIDAAKQSGKPLTNGQIAQLAKNDVYGVMAAAQASIGKTPAQANIAEGALNPTVGNAIQSTLPNTPITQSTVNLIANEAGNIPTP